MESIKVEFPDGEKCTVISFSEEDWALFRENSVTMKTLDSGTDCGFSLPGGDVSFTEITPEDIIGDGIDNRDWGQRSRREKPAHHLHVSYAGIPWVICVEAHADTDDKAVGEAIENALVHLQADVLETLPQEVVDDLLADVEIDAEDPEDSRISRYTDDLNLSDEVCVHDRAESCPDGCAKIVVTHMS